MERTATLLKIIFLCILIFILVGVLVFFINNDFKFNFDEKSALIYDENIENEFNKIDIHSESLDFKFVKSNDDTVNVKVYDNKKNKVNVNVENNTLKIESNNKFKCFFCFLKKREVIISLPEKIYDLAIDTKSGDITSNVDFNKVNIISISGDIEFNKIKKAFIKSTSGDIKIKEVDDLKIKSTSGDLEVNNVNEHIDIKTTSGDVDIDDLVLTEDSNISVISGDVNIYSKSDDIYYNANAISGDIKISNNNRHANNELTIKTKSGDIIIKN